MSTALTTDNVAALLALGERLVWRERGLYREAIDTGYIILHQPGFKSLPWEARQANAKDDCCFVRTQKEAEQACEIHAATGKWQL